MSSRGSFLPKVSIKMHKKVFKGITYRFLRPGTAAARLALLSKHLRSKYIYKSAN